MLLRDFLYEYGLGRYKIDMRYKKKQVNGSMTVEMTVIFPLILMTIITLVYMIYYINDIVCTSAILQKYAILSDASNKTEDDIKNEILIKIKNESLIAEIGNIKVNKGEEETNICVEMNFSLGFFGIIRNDKIEIEMVNISTKDYLTTTKAIFDMIRESRGK